MSRLQRAMEKADREGLLTLTSVDQQRVGDTAVMEHSVAALDGFAPRLTPAFSPPARVEPPPAETMRPTNVGFSPLLVSATRPGSHVAERYRLLRTRLEQWRKGAGTQLLLVTSPGAGDGKTTTGANLALTMAQEFREQVVLVDADLRRSSVAAQFGIAAEPGLSDVLRGAATLEEALVEIDGHGLFVLPAGSPTAGSTELLTSLMMQRLVGTLRGRFSRIVVDTPPIALADSHVLARLADGVLVVVRAGVTTRPAVERALAGVDRQRLIGIVLNDVDETPAEQHYWTEEQGAGE